MLNVQVRTVAASIKGGLTGLIKGWQQGSGGTKTAKSGTLTASAKAMVAIFLDERNAPGLKFLQVASKIDGVTTRDSKSVYDSN